MVYDTGDLLPQLVRQCHGESMSRSDCVAIRRWFDTSFASRVHALVSAVSRELTKWSGDYTESSLLDLDSWLAGRVAARPPTEEELAELRRHVPGASDESVGTFLTEESIAMGVDVGLYFGETVLRGVRGARWQQWLSNQNDVDHGAMVVVGKGRVPLNALNIAMNVARRRASRRSGPSLAELFHVWRETLA